MPVSLSPSIFSLLVQAVTSEFQALMVTWLPNMTLERNHQGNIEILTRHAFSNTHFLNFLTSWQACI